MNKPPERIRLYNRDFSIVHAGDDPASFPFTTEYVRADRLKAVVEALKRAEGYILDAENECIDEIKSLASFPKLAARKVGYLADIRADRDLVRSALSQHEGGGDDRALTEKETSRG